MIDLKKLLVAKHTVMFMLVFAISIIVTVGVLSYGNILRTTGVMYSAEISLISGSVERSEKSGQWVELKSGDNVRQGDLVRVNGAGRTIIMLDDGSAVRLGDNSMVRLQSLDPESIEIVNERGDVYTRVIKAERTFVVRVLDEKYSSLGTAYKTTNTDTEKGVYVYESKVRVLSNNLEVDQGKKYLKNSADTSLINKVTDISSDEISSDTFLQWNKDQDMTNEEFKKALGVLDTTTKTEAQTTTKTETTENNTETKKETEADTQPAAAKIALSVTTSSSGVTLKWTVSNLDTSNGFKLVKGSSENPVYPGNSAVYLGAGSKSYTWNLTNGETYHFRVCQYTGSGCGVYSNNIKVTAPTVASAVNSITLTAGAGGVVNWTVDGTSSQGFKIVWSKTTGPTYPNRSTDQYHYLSSPEARTDTLTAFDGDGDYYVRVCEYLGGKCGKYSNEVTVNSATE